MVFGGPDNRCGRIEANMLLLADRIDKGREKPFSINVENIFFMFEQAKQEDFDDWLK